MKLKFYTSKLGRPFGIYMMPYMLLGAAMIPLPPASSIPTTLGFKFPNFPGFWTLKGQILPGFFKGEESDPQTPQH